MSKILEVFPMKEVREGGGVIVNRVFGYGQTKQFDPFLMLDYFETDSKELGNGFPWHPHKGIETISYMLRGQIEHEDSIGNKDVISAGELQWMTAGRGILHQEMPKPSEDGYQGFQFWVNLPKSEKLTEPKYRDIKQGGMKSFIADGYKVNVIAGEYQGVKGPIDKSNLGISMLHFIVDNNQTIQINRAVNKQGYIFIFKGSGKLNGEIVTEYNAYTLDEGEFILELSDEAEFIFAEGTPLKEPIAWYGPIVMNTNEEIKETLKDLENSTFIKE